MHLKFKNSLKWQTYVVFTNDLSGPLKKVWHLNLIFSRLKGNSYYLREILHFNWNWWIQPLDYCPTQMHFIWNISVSIRKYKRCLFQIFGKLIFVKLADMVTFHTETSSMVKKLQIYDSFVSNLKKKMFMLLIV